MKNPTRIFRSGLSINYKVAKEVDFLDGGSPPNNKRIAVRVRWQYPDDAPTADESKWQEHVIYYTMRNPAL